MSTLSPVFFHRFFDNNGLPLSGGKVYTYAAGTTTPIITYVDSAGIAANTNPIILDAYGYCNIWIGTSSYKFILKDSLDVSIRTVDNVTAASSSSSSNSSQGLKNYITNYEAEADTLGWVTYKDAASATPADGTSGTPALAFTRSTASPLRGTASFLLAKSALNLQGEGVSYDYLIDSADQGKLLTISGDCSLESGTYSGGTSTTKSDVIIYIYDIINSQLIEPVGINIDPGVIGNKGNLYATFQANSNSTSYRLIFHVSTISALAYVLKLDNIVVGPQNIVRGAIISDMTNAPSGFASSWTTNTTTTCKMRRFGDHAEIEWNNALTGAPTAATLTYTLPGGLVIDTTKLTGNVTSLLIDGDGNANRGASGTKLFPTYLSTTSIQLSYISSATTAAESAVNATAPVTWASGDNVTVKIRVPILGWSSSQTLSSDAGTRLVAAKYNSGTAQQNFTNATLQDFINYGVKEFDTHNGFDTITGKYKIQESGIYEVKIAVTFGVNSVNSRVAYILKNGTNISTVCNLLGNAINPTLLIGTTLVMCVAGDTVNAAAFQNSGGVLGSTNDATSNYFSIVKLQGPQQIAASETIKMRATRSTTQSITNSTTTDIIYPTVTSDNTGSYNSTTGIYTANISGTFRAGGATSIAPNATGVRELSVSTTGIGSSTLAYSGNPSGVNDTILTGSTEIQMLAGQTCKLTIFQSSGGALNIAGSGVSYNYFTVSRIGNY